MTAGRIAAYIATGGLVYLATLIATAPAPWVAQAVERTSRQIFLLRNPVGTAWQGSGQIYVRQSSGDLLDLGVLRWNTSPSGILAGKLAIELFIGDKAKLALLEISPVSTSIRGMSLELPASIIASVVPGMDALGPRGKILIRSDALRVDADSVLGLAEVEWRPVGLARAQGLDLGSHVARLRGGGSKIDIELGTIEGPLRLSGGGTWARDGGLIVSGAVEHGEDRSGMIAPFLQGVCSGYRPGRCAFRITHQPAKGT